MVTKVIHYPTLKTVLAVEKVLKEADLALYFLPGFTAAEVGVDDVEVRDGDATPGQPVTILEHRRATIGRCRDHRADRDGCFCHIYGAPSQTTHNALAELWRQLLYRRLDWFISDVSG